MSEEKMLNITQPGMLILGARISLQYKRVTHFQKATFDYRLHKLKEKNLSLWDWRDEASVKNALKEDPSSVPSIYMAAHNHLRL